jgi:hypothetical protein
LLLHMEDGDGGVVDLGISACGTHDDQDRDAGAESARLVAFRRVRHPGGYLVAGMQDHGVPGGDCGDEGADSVPGNDEAFLAEHLDGMAYDRAVDAEVPLESLLTGELRAKRDSSADDLLTEPVSELNILMDLRGLRVFKTAHNQAFYVYL